MLSNIPEEMTKLPPIIWARDRVTYRAVYEYVINQLATMSTIKKHRGRDKRVEVINKPRILKPDEKRCELAKRVILDRLAGNLSNPNHLACDTRVDFVTVAMDLTRYLHCQFPDDSKDENEERQKLLHSLTKEWAKQVEVFNRRFVESPRTDDE